MSMLWRRRLVFAALDSACVAFRNVVLILPLEDHDGSANAVSVACPSTEPSLMNLSVNYRASLPALADEFFESAQQSVIVAMTGTRTDFLRGPLV